MSVDLKDSKSKHPVLLLVEDNEPNILIATIVLKELDYEFHVAKNGLEAVDLFKKGLYSLILMDIQMPLMSGIEATKLIRIHEIEINQAAIPIIALTANNTASDREQCTACGMNDFITKPYMPDQLALLIAGHLEQRTSSLL